MTQQHFQLFRSFTSFIFIYAGIKHLMHTEGILKRVAASTFYQQMPYEGLFRSAILLSGVVLMVAGLALFIGYKSKVAAWLLLAILVPITLTTQLENLNDLGPFFKNVAIAGSLIFIINRKKYENTKHSSDSIDVLHQHSIVRPENTETR